MAAESLFLYLRDPLTSSACLSVSSGVTILFNRCLFPPSVCKSSGKVSISGPNLPLPLDGALVIMDERSLIRVGGQQGYIQLRDRGLVFLHADNIKHCHKKLLS